MSRRAMCTLTLAFALLLLLALPLAEAKGGSSGSGRRNCSASDTNGDGFVSSDERDAQCSDELSGFEATLIALGTLGFGGFAIYKKMIGPGWLQIGEKGTLNGRPFVVIGSIGFVNEDNEPWEEWLVDVQGGAKLWLEVDEGNMILHREWSGARGSLQPPTVNGERVAISEEGVMRVTGSSGVLPPGHTSPGNIPYVDGRIDEGRVSLEGTPGHVTVYRSATAAAKRKHGLVVADKDLRRLLG